jgi:hypothetical protein
VRGNRKGGRGVKGWERKREGGEGGGGWRVEEAMVTWRAGEPQLIENQINKTSKDRS